MTDGNWEDGYEIHIRLYRAESYPENWCACLFGRSIVESPSGVDRDPARAVAKLIDTLREHDERMDRRRK